MWLMTMCEIIDDSYFNSNDNHDDNTDINYIDNDNDNVNFQGWIICPSWPSGERTVLWRIQS